MFWTRLLASAILVLLGIVGSGGAAEAQSSGQGAAGGFLEGYRLGASIQMQKRYLQLLEREQEARLQFLKDLQARQAREDAERREQIRKAQDVLESRARMRREAAISGSPTHLFLLLDGKPLLSNVPIPEPVAADQETPTDPSVAAARLGAALRSLSTAHS